MDIYNQEFISLWKALNECEVKYIMVGGVATNLNGYQRTTDDIDIWIHDTIDNRQKFRKAFQVYSDIDYFMLPEMQIVPGWTFFNLNNGVRMDLMIDVKGLENYSFDQCLTIASNADIDGVIVPFLHINQLIESKKAANRPKDQIDVIYLEKIKQLLEEEERQK